MQVLQYSDKVLYKCTSDNGSALHNAERSLERQCGLSVTMQYPAFEIDRLLNYAQCAVKRT